MHTVRAKVNTLSNCQVSLNQIQYKREVYHFITFTEDQSFIFFFRGKLFIFHCDNEGSVVIIFPLLCNYPDNEGPLIHRGPHHLPPRLLRVPGGQEVVGAVLQAALARHHRLLPGGAGGDPRAGGGEGEGQDGEEDRGEVLHPGLHTLHQEDVNKTEEKISKYSRARQDWNYTGRRGERPGRERVSSFS